jgi:hypothetical protein
MSTSMPMAAILGIFEWWQLVMLALLIALLFFWKMYRNKTM